ncbi:MAG: nucleoside recognition protein [Clostridiales bacterium]|nr:nucleoside recognition protein [Clostridiales bacterium]
MNVIWGMMLLVGIAYGILTGEAQAVSDAVLSSAKEGVSLCITMFGAMALWSGLMEIAKDAGIVRSVTGKMKPVIRFLFPEIPVDHPAIERIAAAFAANMLGLGNAATVYGLKAMEALENLEEERRETADCSTDSAEHPAEARPFPTEVKQRHLSPGGTEPRYSAPTRAKRRVQTLTPNKAQRRVLSFAPHGTASNEMCTFLILNISSLQLIPITVIAYRGQYGSVNPSAVVGPGIVATAASTGAAVVFCKLMDRITRAK